MKKILGMLSVIAFTLFIFGATPLLSGEECGCKTKTCNCAKGEKCNCKDCTCDCGCANKDAKKDAKGCGCHKK